MGLICMYVSSIARVYNMQNTIVVGWPLGEKMKKGKGKSRNLHKKGLKGLKIASF